MKLYFLNVEGSTSFFGGQNLNETMGLMENLFGFTAAEYKAVVFEVDHKSLRSLTVEEANAIVMAERRSLN